MRVLALAFLLALGGCALKAAADCSANPDAPCEGDERARGEVRDMSPAEIPDARRLPRHLAPARSEEEI